MKLQITRRTGIGITLLLIAGIGGVLLNGFTLVDASGTCYQKTVTCHGLPIDTCIGTTTSSVDYVPAPQCAELENITQRCQQSRNFSCQDGATGNEWKANVETYGQTCAAWESAYDLSFAACN